MNNIYQNEKQKLHPIYLSKDDIDNHMNLQLTGMYAFSKTKVSLQKI